MALSLHLWQAYDATVRDFLKMFVLSFNVSEWVSFFCETCAKEKSVHCQAKHQVEIAKEAPLKLMLLDILGRFSNDADGYRYIITIQDQVSTFTLATPLRSHSDALVVIQLWLNLLKVQKGAYPKALCTDNAKELTSALFSNAVRALGIILVSVLPYSVAEKVNRTLGDMVWAILCGAKLSSSMWRFAYLVATYIHNRIPNSRCQSATPFTLLFKNPPSIPTLYPFGAVAFVHLCHMVECALQLASINQSFNRFNSLFGKSSLC
ncbi:hypothetical protein O181_007971 [Austropuccinia psidii MF-1]|uniref:Integrase catalytic domain-containing protein n=1 Tax=Austropuccinia psidii MF-1 TaxID=1389203 RepID=A0A9Q3BLT1_9BASI|nr:hypothetical protein [Austropuccinia psidii MF-1]